MRLPRIGDKPEERLLEQAATKSLICGDKIIDLSALAAAHSLDVRQAGLSLEKKGYGRLLEISGNGIREYHFSITSLGFEVAHEIRMALRARTLLGRLERINWNAVSAVAAIVAALAALVAAYYSYLGFVTDHAQTH